MTRFSIILTTYNSSNFIKATVDSILGQEGHGELFELELIVVDDLSTDSTKDILSDYDILFLQNETNTGGPNRGRNKGLELASGDYICISDHDDIWHSDRILSILPHLESATIITSGYILKDLQSQKVVSRVNRSAEESVYYHNNRTFLKLLKKHKGGQICYLGSIVYSNKLKDIHFEEEYGSIDFDWLLSLFYEQDSLEICNTLYTRIVDGQNLSLNQDYRENDLVHSLRSVDIYAEQYPKAVRSAKKRIYGTFARYLYLMGDMTRARVYFKRSTIDWKTLAYYCTTFFGSGFIKRHFKIFG